MASIDVTVKGAGIFGLACAWELARRGARVQVVDPAGPGAGASGGLLGALAPHAPDAWNAKKQFQIEALQAGPGFWAGVEAAAGQDVGYARLGRLQPIADQPALSLAQSRVAAAARHWPGEVWEVILATGGFAPVSASGWLIRDTLSARIAPRRAIAALVAALRAAGVAIRPEAPEAGAVLWATGSAGLADLSATFDRPVGIGVPGQAALLAFDARGAPQLFADGIHIVPHADGTTAVGSTDAADGLDALIDAARHLVPPLAGARVIERWAGMRPRAKTRAPILGHWPGRPCHYLANGGFKIGFGLAPKVASTLADLILGGTDTVPPGFRLTDNL